MSNFTWATFESLVDDFVMTPLRRKLWMLKAVARGERDRAVRRRFRRAA